MGFIESVFHIKYSGRAPYMYRRLCFMKVKKWFEYACFAVGHKTDTHRLIHAVNVYLTLISLPLCLKLPPLKYMTSHET